MNSTADISTNIIGTPLEEERSDIMEAIDSMSDDQLFSYSDMKPVDLYDYSRKQTKWIQDAVYYLGIDLGHIPTAGEIADKLLNSNHTQRFRAFYALKYPEKVEHT
ncbi:MAG: hypothetical protein MI748_20065 [Opitutales bacterium]|nr:hypothetical protein [Opitutales bacterium]